MDICCFTWQAKIHEVNLKNCSEPKTELDDHKYSESHHGPPYDLHPPSKIAICNFIREQTNRGTGANASSLSPSSLCDLLRYNVRNTPYSVQNHRPQSSVEYLGSYYESSQTLSGPGKRLINNRLGRWTSHSISLVVKAQGTRNLG